MLQKLAGLVQLYRLALIKVPALENLQKLNEALSFTTTEKELSGLGIISANVILRVPVISLFHKTLPELSTPESIINLLERVYFTLIFSPITIKLSDTTFITLPHP